MNEHEFIPGSDNTLPEFENAPKGRCIHPRHNLPAGWCPSCDSEWDHTADLTEEQMQEAFDSQLADWRADLEAAEFALRLVKAAEPRDVVAVVEARKRRNDVRSKIENLGYQWRVGGNAPTKRDNL